MNKIWQKKYNLRANDFDKFGNIFPSAVLDLFQDAASQHAEELGAGFDKMLEKSLLWILVRMKFTILKMPSRYDEVIVKTWPIGNSKVTYRREYQILDLNGNEIIKGSSDWAIMHFNSRKLVLGENPYPFSEGFCGVLMHEGKLTKIKDFEYEENSYKINTAFSEVDMNNHINNTKYAAYILNSINPKDDFKIKTFQIDYRKETLPNETLDIYNKYEDDSILSKGINENSEIVFVSKMELN